MARKHLDVAIAELAGRQHEVLSAADLERLRATEGAIRHRVAVRRLYYLYPGVYATVPPRALRYAGHLLAATLTFGDDAVVSHRSAGAHLGLCSVPAGDVDVTVPRRGLSERDGIRIHVVRSLDPADVTMHGGVPCTTWARALLDMAEDTTDRLLRRAIEQAQILRIYDQRKIDDVLDRANGRRGAGRLKRVIADVRGDEPPRLNRELERRFLELITDAGLPEPVVNGLVEGFEVDFHWPAQKLIVETDGRETHATPIAFERDRERDLVLEAADWRVIRLTWRQVTEDPERVVALLRKRLAS
jgi:REase_MTES_1575